ncbi:MAG: OB-fold domain-containing protein [Actinobacteria bacterium]|nr:OB-fold domain-containing protein [Actinomycetota bacterium]
MARVPVHPGLFELDGGTLRLVGGYSPSSGRFHFPSAPVCPYTGADDVEEVTLPEQGRLWSWTAVNAAPPGYSGPAPYGFGVVELENGLRVVGRLTEPDPGALSKGQPMRVVPEEIGTDEDGRAVVTWAFAPSAGEG